MITRLKVENFTAFDSLELEFGEGIHAFVGANGTGKTHLLKIIYALYVSAFSYVGYKIEKVFKLKLDTANHLLRERFNQSKIDLDDPITQRKITLRVDGLINAEFNHKSGDFLSGVEFEHGANDFLSLEGHICIYIPVKDILGNAKGFQSLYRLRETSFEEVYDDILTRAYLPRLKTPNPNYKPLLEKIEKFIGGKVESRDEEFYLVTDKKALELSLVAEGWRKFALLWLLLQNGSLEKGSVLFWDEPEANLNPSALPLLAHILLQLSREGVQVFLATHSYVLLKELDLQKEKHPVNYHSLYFEDGEVRASTAQDYDDIQHNLIERENRRLYYAELGHVLDEEALIKLEDEQ